MAGLSQQTLRHSHAGSDLYVNHSHSFRHLETDELQPLQFSDGCPAWRGVGAGAEASFAAGSVSGFSSALACIP
jgi:hypothetical protein